MTIITGIGRSGTSLLALWLRECGVPIVGTWIDSVEAGMEDPRVSEINEGMDEDMTDDRALELIHACNFVVAKDPRLTRRASRKLKLWKQGQPNIRIILTHRDPAQAFESRCCNGLPYWQSPLQAQLAFAETVTALLTLDIPSTLLMFPRMLYQFDAIYHAFNADPQIRLPPFVDASTVWTKLVDSDLVHDYERRPVLKGNGMMALPDTGSAWRESDFLWPGEQHHARP